MGVSAPSFSSLIEPVGGSDESAIASFDSRCYHYRMAQLLVRDIPRDIVEALKRRAAQHGRSAEAEHRAILQEALHPARAAFRQRVKALRDQTRGRIEGDSADLIREDRDSR